MNTKNTAAFVNQLLVGTLVMICFGGSLGLGTVWLRHQMTVTADNTKQMEQRLAEVQRHIGELNTQISEASTIAELNARNAQWNLGLVQPRDQQVVWVGDSPERRLSERNNAAIFASEAVNAASVRFPLAVADR